MLSSLWRLIYGRTDGPAEFYRGAAWRRWLLRHPRLCGVVMRVEEWWWESGARERWRALRWRFDDWRFDTYIRWKLLLLRLLGVR